MNMQQAKQAESAKPVNAIGPELKTWVAPVLESLAGADGVMNDGSANSDGGGRSSGTAS